MAMRVPAAERRRRLGWIGGGTGSLLWLLPVGLLAVLRGQVLAAILAAAGFTLGLLYVVGCAPWRFPRTPFAVFYGGLVVIVICLAVLLACLMLPLSLRWGDRMALLLPLLILVIPLAVFGRRPWSELSIVLMRRDDDQCGR